MSAKGWLAIAVGLLAALALLARLVIVLPGFFPRPPLRKVRTTPTYLLVVLGSGGHTAEMMLLVKDLDTASYNHRRYVISAGDVFSVERAVELERLLEQKATSSGRSYGSYDVKHVRRARKIHQGLLSTVFTAALCAWDCVRVLRQKPTGLHKQDTQHGAFPDLILSNGPATATIMIFASIFIRLIGVPGSAHAMRCVYVESWARVKQLSLSGNILRVAGACDRLVVQWPGLAHRGADFRGQLVA